MTIESCSNYCKKYGIAYAGLNDGFVFLFKDECLFFNEIKKILATYIKERDPLNIFFLSFNTLSKMNSNKSKFLE